MRRKVRNGLCILTQISILILLVASITSSRFGLKEEISVDKLRTDFSYKYIEVEKNIDEEIVDNVVTEVIQPISENENVSLPIVDTQRAVLDTYYGRMTAYGPDCRGCSGITASDYDVRNTITYYDSEFGEVRIVAADSSIPFNSIVRIFVDGESPIVAIVLDTGGNIGFSRPILFDLLFESEAVAASYGTRNNVKFELLRRGN